MKLLYSYTHCDANLGIFREKQNYMNVAQFVILHDFLPGSPALTLGSPRGYAQEVDQGGSCKERGE